jgi:hypothetical protein
MPTPSSMPMHSSSWWCGGNFFLAHVLGGPDLVQTRRPQPCGGAAPDPGGPTTDPVSAGMNLVGSDRNRSSPSTTAHQDVPMTRSLPDKSHSLVYSFRVWPILDLKLLC